MSKYIYFALVFLLPHKEKAVQILRWSFIQVYKEKLEIL